MRPKIEEMLANIDIVLQQEKKLFNDIRMLSETKMNHAHRQLLTCLFFNITAEEYSNKEKELSTRKLNQIDEFGFDLKLETDDKGDNLWGLFSGLTRYTTHDMKKTDNSEGKMFGQTGVRERRVFKELVEMV